MAQAVDLSYLDNLYVGNSLLTQALQEEQAAKGGTSSTSSSSSETQKTHKTRKPKLKFDALPTRHKLQVTKETVAKKLLEKAAKEGPAKILEEAKKLGVTEGTVEALKKHALGASDGEVVAHRAVGNFYESISDFLKKSIDGNQSMMIAGIQAIKAKDTQMNTLNQDLKDNINQANDTTGKAADANKKANEAKDSFWGFLGAIVAVVVVTCVVAGISAVVGPEAEVGAELADDAIMDSATDGISDTGSEMEGSGDTGESGESDETTGSDETAELDETTGTDETDGTDETGESQGEKELDEASKEGKEEKSWLRKLKENWSKEKNAWSRFNGRFFKYAVIPGVVIGSMGMMASNQFNQQYQMTDLNAQLQQQATNTQIDSNLADVLNQNINEDMQLQVQNPTQANQAASSQISQVIGDMVKVESVSNN